MQHIKECIARKKRTRLLLAGADLFHRLLAKVLQHVIHAYGLIALHQGQLGEGVILVET